MEASAYLNAVDKNLCEFHYGLGSLMTWAIATGIFFLHYFEVFDTVMAYRKLNKLKNEPIEIDMLDD